MNQVLLFDFEDRAGLLPFTFTRPSAELRVGILTIKEKWSAELKTKAGYCTASYLRSKYPFDAGSKNLFIKGNLLPDPDVVDAITSLPTNTLLYKGNQLLAGNLSADESQAFSENASFSAESRLYEGSLTLIEKPWHIYLYNDREIRNDLLRVHPTASGSSITANNFVHSADQVYVEEGVNCQFAFIDASEGPVYLGKNSTVLQGSMIKGPFALCDHATVKMGAKIYGATTIGPYSKVAGEINNSVIWGYSNKGHEGFLGNSVIGQWCNIGADTNNSNLKNNYDEVRIWDYKAERFADSGQQFCGLFMGDHTRCGINTMFNTGTVVGVSANIFGSGFPRTFIPSFTWGGAAGFKTYMPEKAFLAAEKMMERRGVAFDKTEEDLLRHVFNLTQKYRK